MKLTLDYVLTKSASRIQGLHPVVQKATVKLIEHSYAKGIPILITQGLRTIAEQNDLYAQGRTKAGKIVTNAKGGYSNHNFGVAIDFCLLLPDGKNVSWDNLKDGNLDSLPDWSQVVDEAKKLGFSWGGDWKSFKDLPHFEMTFGLSTAQFRAGVKPSEKELAKALANIEKEVDKVTNEAYEALEKEVKQLKDTVQRLVGEVNLNGKQTPPPWSHEAISAAKACGAITSSDDKSKAELRVIQMMYNMGLYNKEKSLSN